MFLNRILIKNTNSRHYRPLFIPYYRHFSKTPLDFDPKKNYYKVLEARENASKEEIKNCYFRLAQFYHPDRNGGDQHNLSKF